MEIVRVGQGQVIARKNDKVNCWYLIKEGTVIQKFDVFEIKLSKNSIVGILEKDIYMCEYVAGEDVVMAAFPCENAESLKNILSGEDKIIRNIFLRTAIEQRHNLLCLYSELYAKTRQFHTFVESAYNDYKVLCEKYRVPEDNFARIEHFNPLNMQHKAENWEVNNSISIVKNHLKEYLQLMEKDDSLTVGVIMEASAQMRRFTKGIGEMESYLTYNKDILMGAIGNDIFRLYFDLAIKFGEKKIDIGVIDEKIAQIGEFARRIGVYNDRMITRSLKEYEEYDHSARGENAESGNIRKEMDITATDCMGHILEYAGCTDEEVEEISNLFAKYRNLPDMLSTDSAVYALRKKITAIFYDVYYKVFIKAVDDERSLTPVIEMFLNFGFMDLSYVGEEHAKYLYELCAHIDICKSQRIYTIYEWLKCVYRGEKESSKNEFDLNYPAYLAQEYKMGNITKEQLKEDYEDRKKLVAYEIKNMFASVNRLTYGKITTFCPVLCDVDLITSIDKMLVTVEKLEAALNEVRKVDYSVFYREVSFADPDKGINNERIMKEILPDIILMPNAGTKVMMWQETAGVKSDTPGRFMFPIFTAVDLEDMMLEAIGRFRWEMCRKIQGVHWNDIREKSLTSEYCEYIQFYKKNSDLSAEAKEKIKLSLMRAKNNYREVFVKDYINWIKFESKGSFRLNKIAREILIIHCPFVKSIRNELKINPIYGPVITRFENENAKKLQRYTAAYNKYVAAGGTKTMELKDNIMFYEM